MSGPWTRYIGYVQAYARRHGWEAEEPDWDDAISLSVRVVGKEARQGQLIGYAIAQWLEGAAVLLFLDIEGGYLEPIPVPAE